MSKLEDALLALGLSNWSMSGDPTSEAEFSKNFRMVTGIDPDGAVIESRNPDDWGVTWEAIQEKIVETSANEAKGSIRTQRDKLLAESDWVVTKAIERNAQDGLGVQIPVVWLDYRQALRDIPQQAGFPENVTWPEEPNG